MDSKGNCETCGARITDANPETDICPYCDSMKCERCDMGNDVRCIACEEEK
jgi:hypothetical protein